MEDNSLSLRTDVDTGGNPGGSGNVALAFPRAPAPADADADVALSPSNVPAPESDASDAMRDALVAALKSVYDPEIPVDIYELGLIYKVEQCADGSVDIDMTLTAPACPVAEHMPIWVRDAVSAVEGVGEVRVNMVFEPPWDPSRMSDEARLMLDMF